MKIYKKTLFFAALIALCAFLSACGSGDSVPKGSVAGGVELGGMERSEAISALSQVTLSEDATAELKVDIYTISFTAGDINARYDAASTVDNIINAKRSFFEKLFSSEKQYDMAVEIDDTLLDSAISNKLYGIEREVSEISYEMTNEGIVVTNALSGLWLDRQSAKDELCRAFGSVAYEPQTLELERTEPQEVDYDVFLSQFDSEAADATFMRDADGNIVVTQDSVGVSIDLETAKLTMQQHTSEGETYTIAATIVMPTYTKSELEATLFADTLGTYSTSFASSSENRATNITKAAASINGLIFLPGETFSFNDALGERTLENGYLVAHTYSSGQVVDQVGGGICQVSSTLYNSVLLANLQITERRSHQMTVSYVPLGRDATVNWGTQDFKFTNNTYYPIKIEAYTSGKKVYVSIIGTQPDKTQKVEITTETISVTEPTVKTEEDPTMPVGETKITTQGTKGYVVDSYRIVYSNGVELSREKLKRSTYNATQTVMKVGTMVVETATETPAA